MTDAQLEILMSGLKDGKTLRKTMVEQGWVAKGELSRKTMRPVREAFIAKYGKAVLLERLKVIREHDYNSPVRTAIRAAKRAAAALAAKKPVLVSPDTVKERLEICRACEFLDKAKSRTCTVCKCNVNAKTRLATEKCPKGKWPE